MAEFYITTTGTQDPVVLNDLGGRSFAHPTTAHNLGSEYSLAELQASNDLWQAIADGHLTAQDKQGNAIEEADQVQTALPAGYVSGLNMSLNAANPNGAIDISPGRIRSDDDTTDIVVPSGLTVTLPTDLDTGTEQGNTWYYIWLIYNPTTKTVSKLFSESATSPTLPSGYTKKAKIPGAVRNGPASTFIPFRMVNMPHGRFVIYRNLALTSIIGAGTQSSWTDVSCANFVPPQSRNVIVNIRLYNLGSNAYGYLRENGTSDTYGNYVWGKELFSAEVIQTLDENQVMEYRTALGTYMYAYAKGYWVDS